MLSEGCECFRSSKVQRFIKMKQKLVLILVITLSGCGFNADTDLVCDGDEAIYEHGRAKEKSVRGAVATMKKDMLGRPDSIVLQSKSLAEYKGKFQYESQPGYYVFQEGNPDSTESSISLKPTNGKMLLIRRQGGELVFSADYICHRVDGIK